MEKEQYRSVIRFLFLKGKSRAEIKVDLDAMYGGASPSLATIKRWFNEFKNGRTSVFDEDRPGRPNEVTTEKNIEKIHDMILADRRLKLREMAESCGLSLERVQNIVVNHLGF